ncbi:MAG TPA: hypothetical protein DCL61_24960 [Cyanobacteria bacterium UBA12227]|nr:hypothetical protein [Cyanobacteria bacterium UBA12227]HAX87247.1 hypothetical protein [Cyanobacteria bacterium UBA11370]HBY75467.1 hypothetical protein [Cyanobacteria bacterium UBA11148]
MTQLLNLNGVIVEDSRQRDETLILSIRVANKKANCPRCKQTSYRLHQNRFHLVRDLPMGTYEVILRVNRRQFKCEYCKKPFSEILNFVGNRKRFTHRYAQMITEEVIHSDIHNVAKKNGLTDEEVWSMVMAIAEEIMPIPVEKLRRLGIDEISLVKGQGKFIVVWVDLETHKLVGLVPERKQPEIEKAMQKWGEEVLAKIKEEFHQIFEERKDLGTGTLELIDWLKKAEPYYKKSVKTIKRWLAEVVGYFERRTTNGIVEGINNKLKVLKRCGFGFRNFNNFEIRALLYWHFSDIS